MEKDKILDILAKERNDKSISANKLGEKIGVAHTTVTRLDSGKISSPSLELIIKYADYLGYELKLVKKSTSKEKYSNLYDSASSEQLVDTIAEDGFIENYVLPEEKSEQVKKLRLERKNIRK